MPHFTPTLPLLLSYPPYPPYPVPRTHPQSKQLRLLNESKGDTYVGKDPRALQADGSYAGYRLDHQYIGTDLLQSNSTSSIPTVSAYSRTGIVKSNGPRLRPSPKSISAASDIVIGGRRPRKGGAQAYTDAAYSSSALRRSPSFVSRTERFLPSRTWAGTDPRAVMADDPFDGIHPHQYQASSNYYAAFDPTALTRKEEEHLQDVAKRASEHQEHRTFVKQQQPPLFESKQPTPADITAEREKAAAEKQALLASAAKSGFADTRHGYSEPMPTQLAVHNSFHDTNDQFRFGILVKQPKGKLTLPATYPLPQVDLDGARTIARRRPASAPFLKHN